MVNAQPANLQVGEDARLSGNVTVDLAPLLRAAAGGRDVAAGECTPQTGTAWQHNAVA